MRSGILWQSESQQDGEQRGRELASGDPSPGVPTFRARLPLLAAHGGLIDCARMMSALLSGMTWTQYGRHLESSPSLELYATCLTYMMRHS